MTQVHTIYLGLSLVLALIGCNGCRENRHTQPISEAELRKELIEKNKSEHQEERKAIDAYIQQKGWSMTETGTGLRYMITQKGTGAQPKAGDQAVVAYTVKLMDGTVCYSATPANPGTFLIGQDNVETGLHEAVLLMHVGDQATLILPSHLAFGLTGDSERIPQKATLMYDLQLLAVQ